MSDVFIEMTENEFDDRFALITNHLNPSASWGYDEEAGCLFETYGEEVEFVKQQDMQRVWTLVDGDDGDLYLISGFHYVNRIGYLISRDPIPENITIQVHIPMDTVEEPEEVEARS